MSNETNHSKILIIKPGLSNVDRSKVSKTLKALDATKAGSAWQVPGANADSLGAIADFIDAIVSNNGAIADHSGAIADQGDPTDREQLKNDLSYFFQLFQRNASKLSITGEDKSRLKNILRRLRK